MGKDFERRAVKKQFQRVFIPGQVAAKQFESGTRGEGVDGVETGAIMQGAFIVQIVAVDDGDDGVVQLQRGDGFSEPNRLIEIGRRRGVLMIQGAFSNPT